MSSSLKVARILSIPNVVDGDTLWAQLEYVTGETLDGRELIERDYVGGSKLRLSRQDLTLNTPEKPKKSDPEYLSKLVLWTRASRELETWAYAALSQGNLTAEIFAKDSFGRYLSDLNYGDLIAADGSSAVAYMRSRGWAAYEG